MIRVLLADDQDLIRSAVADLIDHEPGFEVVGQAADGQAAVELARAVRPDILLMDVRMPRMDGIEATAAICADPALAETRVLVLTTYEVDEYVLRALRAGASGFIGKGTSPAELMDAIRVVHDGESLLSPRATRALIDRYLDLPDGASPPVATRELEGLGDVTEREREVFLLVARGLTNDDIAERLVISPHTAKTHVNRVMAKLRVHDRAQLVILAYEQGWLRPGEPG